MADELPESPVDDAREGCLIWSLGIFAVLILMGFLFGLFRL